MEEDGAFEDRDIDYYMDHMTTEEIKNLEYEELLRERWEEDDRE